MTFSLLEVCMRKKLLPLLFSVSFFYFVSSSLLVSVFVLAISFFFKKKPLLKIVLMTPLSLQFICQLPDTPSLFSENSRDLTPSFHLDRFGGCCIMFILRRKIYGYI